jgi:hypothetical protein
MKPLQFFMTSYVLSVINKGWPTSGRQLPEWNVTVSKKKFSSLGITVYAFGLLKNSRPCFSLQKHLTPVLKHGFYVS